MIIEVNHSLNPLAAGSSPARVTCSVLRTEEVAPMPRVVAPVQALRVIPAEAPFDGDPHRFCLGLEATRLSLSTSTTRTSLSIARADPLPVPLTFSPVLPQPVFHPTRVRWRPSPGGDP